jgi:tetratricopeptide (TPR) repeat protein
MTHIVSPHVAASGVAGAKGLSWVRPLLVAGVIVAILGATLWAYWPVATRGVFIFDDDTHLTGNPVLQPGGLAKVWQPITFVRDQRPGGWGWSVRPAGYIDYWPLTFTAYWLGYQCWGLDPVGFHLMNLAAYALCALLVWRVLAMLRVPGAMLAGAIFALHPVNVETAAWISQLKTMLSVALALASVMAYLWHERRGAWWRYAMALVLFLLSCLAKPTAVTLPAVLLLLAWWQRGKIDWRDMLRAIPYLGIAAGLSALAVWMQQALTAGQVIRTDPMLSRVALAGTAVWFYLGELVWPANLTLVYPRWWADPHDLLWYRFDVALLAALIVAWIWRRSWGRPVLVALGCYLALLLPVLGFVNISFMEHSLVADHWQYMAMIAPIALFAAGATTSVEWAGRRWGLMACRGAGWAMAIVLLGVLGRVTYAQASLYPDVQTLWESVLKINPNSWLAHNDLGLELRKRGKLEDAMYQYRRAIWLNDDFALAHLNLGEVLALLGRYDEAIDQDQQALRCTPEYGAAHNNLGWALVQSGRPDQAIPELRRAIAMRPDYALAYVNLGTALTKLGRYEQAVDSYQTSEELDSKYPPVHLGMATALLALDRTQAAISELEQAVALDGNYGEALYHLAWLRASREPGQGGDPAEAVMLAERLDTITKHQEVAAREVLAAAYASAGRFAQAVAVALDAQQQATNAGRRDAAAIIDGELASYRAGQPIRAAEGAAPAR